MIALLVMTDGRDDLLARTLDSAEQNLRGPITRRVIHTDNGMQHRRDLALRYGDWLVIGGKRRGFGGAIDRAWKALEGTPERFVFHLEDDFTFNRPVDLTAMMAVLHSDPKLHQLCLRRQPWNEVEQKAGGIVESWPDAYTERSNAHGTWLEHRLFFSTNPSLYRLSLTAGGWPTGARSEGRFSEALFTDPEARCGFWGSRDSGEAVCHIGTNRVGVSY